MLHPIGFFVTFNLSTFKLILIDKLIDKLIELFHDRIKFQLTFIPIQSTSFNPLQSPSLFNQ